MYPPAGLYSDSYAKDMSVVRTRLQWLLLVGLFILLFAIPQFTSSYWITFATTLIIILISVQGINILTGYCGQITLGQAAFMMVGGFTSAMLTNQLGLSFWIALPCSALLAVVIGIIFALPSVRVKGLYLALTTLAAQFILTWIIVNIPQFQAAQGLGAPAPSLFGMLLDTPQEFYYLTVVIGALMIFFAKNIARTGLGRAFIAIRDNDRAAKAAGINIFYYKLIAFAICSFYAGVAGSLYAHHLNWITVDGFSLMDSVWYIGMAIVGGLGSIVGPIFGVTFIVFLRQAILLAAPNLIEIMPFLSTGTISGLLMVVFGLVILMFLILEPRGLAHRWQVIKSSYRFWPFTHWG